MIKWFPRITLFLVLSLTGSGIQAQPLSGQIPLAGSIKEWNALLESADRSLGKPDLPDERLEALREEVGRIRSEVFTAADAIRPQARAVRDELQALGPSPAEGQPPEAPTVADKRKAIVERLAAIEGSIKESELIIARADRILDQVSALRRSRFAERLLARGPLPISPAVWGKALPEYREGFAKTQKALVDWVDRETFAQQIHQWGVHLVLVLAATFALAWPLRGWILRRFGYVTVETEPSHRQRLWTALVTGLVRSLLPTVVTVAVYLVLQSADVFGEPEANLARTGLLALIFFYFVAAFSRAALAPYQPAWRIVPLNDEAARYASRILTALAFVFALDWMANEVGDQYGASLEQAIVHKFLSGLVITTLLLAMLRERVWCASAGAQPAGMRQHLWRRMRWLLRLLVLAIPGSALLGYVALSRVLATQLVLTPGIYLATVLLRRIGAESIRHTLSRQSAAGLQIRQGLSLTDEGCEMLAFWLTEAMGLVILLIGAIGLLMLWGVRWDDLATGLYTAFVGFKVGNVTLSLSEILLAVLMFSGILTATRLFQRMLEHRLFPRTRLDLGLRNSIRALVGYCGFLLSFAVAVSVIGIDLNNLAIIAGALSVGIGFGLQNIVNNFVSGLILLAERPIKVGDWVVVGEHQGHVRKISVRATEITTFDRASVFIPNSNLIASPVMNRTYADKVGRIVLPVSIAYGTDALKARDLLLSTLHAHPEIARSPAPTVFFKAFGDSAIQLEIVAFLNDVDKVGAVTSDLGFAIDAAFRREGIQMPFPQRDVHLHLKPSELESLHLALQQPSKKSQPLSAMDPRHPIPAKGE